MKARLIILSCILFFSCANDTKKEKPTKTKESQPITKNEVKPVDTKSTYEKAMLKMDSTIRVLCDTSFLIQNIDTIEINTVHCAFQPYMLIVNDGNLKLKNYTLDSTYNIKTERKVHTATWSPFNQNEIFLLLREEFILSKSDSINFPFFCQKPPFNLKLYRLNLDSLKMYGISSFYNKIIPLVKLQYEIADFFPRNSVIKVDSENNAIYYDAVSLMIDYDYFENKGTYKVDLNTRETSLTKPITFEQKKNIGEKVKIYSNAYHQKNNYKAQVDDSIIRLFDISSNIDTLEISAKLFDGNEQVHIKNIESDSVLKQLQFNFCFTKDSNYIIGSPYTEHDMAVLHGNIYLIDKNTHDFKLLIGNRVVGYNVDLYSIENGMSILNSYWNMHILDTNFTIKNKLPKIQHFEIK